MTAGETDPWSGDDVPIAPAPDSIVWDSPPDLSDGDPARADDVNAVSRRSVVFSVVATAAVAIVGLGIFVWPGRDEPAAGTPSTAPPAPSTLDTLPSATDAPATTVTRDAVEVSDGDGEVSDGEVGDGETGDAEQPVLDELPEGDLPSSVAAAELATEVIVVTSDGELVMLDLPSGDVIERVDLGLERSTAFRTGTIVSSPDAVMYSAGSDLVVVPTGRGVVPIDRDRFETDDDTASAQVIPFGWTTDADGASVFVIISFDGTGRQLEWLVTSDGEVTPAPTQRTGTFARPLYSVGTRFVDDAGGAYRVDPNGDSTRISDGQILATSETRLLLRECDADRRCVTTQRDYDGLEVRSVDVPAAFQPRFFAASLSPDGTAVTFIDSNFTGERTIFDFDSGETLRFSGQEPTEISSPSWSADSSGIFTFGAAAGIRYLERATGEELTFATGLGRVRALTTRAVPG